MRRMDRRLGLLFCLFSLLFIAAFARAAWLQGVRGGDLRAEARGQQVTVLDVPGLRGQVLDRNGKALAVSEDAVSVIATPYQVKDPAGTAELLSPLTGEPEIELEDALSDRESGFAYLARKVDLASAEKIEKLGIHGIATLPDARRIYPQGELAAQVIGAVGTENEGLTGFEAAKEDVLDGEDGRQEITRDASGSPIRFETAEQATTGDDIQLTIDAAIQARAEEALAEAGEAYGAQGASAVVMNPRTGDVYAMANWPAYDPNDVGSATEEELVNRATGFTYEPGSTFKAFTVAAALEEGIVAPSTAFDLPSTIKVADRVIEEAHARPPVTLTVADILAQSSNVGAVTIGLEVGSERFDHWIREFGFDEPTGIEFPAEEQGIVPSYEEYSGSTIGNVPIGQGLSVTPMQMAAGYAAIANGGMLRTPRLVAQVDGERVEPEDDERRVISESTAKQLRGMLEGVLAPGGTASEVEVPGYVLAGKTGTAQKAENGTYSETDYVASFVGFAPASKPELLVAVVVDEPVYEHSGGAVAAPVFGDIAEFALPYLGISPG
jgi:cell division protein FtsI (penicillin-binding protein 3)